MNLIERQISLLQRLQTEISLLADRLTQRQQDAFTATKLNELRQLLIHKTRDLQSEKGENDEGT